MFYNEAILIFKSEEQQVKNFRCSHGVHSDYMSSGLDFVAALLLATTKQCDSEQLSKSKSKFICHHNNTIIEYLIIG